MSIINVMKSTFFGIEIEFTGMSCSVASNVVSKVMKSFRKTSASQGVRSDAYNHWSVVRDSSVNSASGYSADCCELVSPKLMYCDLPLLEEILDKLVVAGMVVNKSCGVHIHLDGKDYTCSSLLNLLSLFGSKQSLIYEALDVESSRAANFCKFLPASFLDKTVAAPNRNGMELFQLSNIWYGYLSSTSSSTTSKYNSSRYHGINLHSFWYRGTVEFRIFNSTTSFDVIKSYIDFCLLLHANALQGTGVRYTGSVSTSNPKYTMRAWLVHLGLNGAEFAASRKVLLSKLLGDSAFLDGRRVAM